MARVEIEWTMETTETYKAVLDVPDDMTPEEFIESIKDDPYDELPGLEEDANHEYGGDYEREVIGSRVLS